MQQLKYYLSRVTAQYSTSIKEQFQSYFRIAIGTGVTRPSLIHIVQVIDIGTLRF